MHRFRFHAFAIAVVCAAPAQAQTFPERPMRMIVPFAPGGIADIVARIVGQKMGETLGQTVVIDNRTGAGGAIAGETVAKARPDGYTILLCSSSVAVINPLLAATTPYDPHRDFAPISLVSYAPFVLLVQPSSPLNSVRDLIAAARAKPGAITFGSAGMGSASHLAGELFKSAAKVDLTHVPYKGTAPAAAALLAGDIQLSVDSITAALPHLKSGRLRALGITARKASALAPDIPTVSDSGVPGFEGITWQGMCAPAATPRPVMQVLGKAVAGAVKSPDVAQRFASLGVEGVGNNPEEFRAFIRSEHARWEKVIREAGIKAK